MLTDNNIRDCFKDHKINYREYGIEPSINVGFYQDLRFFKPGTSIYQVNYLIHKNLLFVSGDCYAATYQWADKINFEFLAGLDLNYFASKCIASPTGAGFKAWDGDTAKETLRDIIKDCNDDNQITLREEDWDIIEDYIHHEHEWHRWADDNLLMFGGIGYECLMSIGEVIDSRCRFHLIGLWAAFELLKKERE